MRFFPRPCGYQSKNHCSFKHKYTISNMGLLRYNKRFCHVTCNVPGNAHDARLLRVTKVFSVKYNLEGQFRSNTLIQVGRNPISKDKGHSIPSISLAVESFPSQKDSKKHYFNVKLCSARVVTENAYGFFNGRWHLICKKYKSKMHNVKYVIMACVLQHGLCIARQDLCIPRWKLHVDELSFVE